MALITCPDCGKEVSDAADACIHCGRPMADANRQQRTVRTRESIWWHERGGNIALLIILGVVLLIAVGMC